MSRKREAGCSADAETPRGSSRVRSGGTALLFAAACLLVSCGRTVKETTTENWWKGWDHNYPPGEYKIQVGDVLDVQFYERPQMNQEVTVRPDGNISLQLVRDIAAVNKSPSTLSAELEQQYHSEIPTIRIAVIVRSFSAQRAFVTGEVSKPQQVDLRGTTTVLQAISMAGGTTPVAQLEEVVVIRRGTSAKPAATAVNLAKVIDGTDTTQDMVLLPNDIVVVPRTHIGNLNVWVDQYLRKMIPFNTSVGIDFRANNQ